MTNSPSKVWGKKYRAKMKAERPWLRHWLAVQSRCISPSSSYHRKGIKNHLTKQDVFTLWCRDNAQALKRPSIDRIDTSADYTLDNCRFIEFMDNLRRTTSRRDGMFIQQLWTDGSVRATFLNCSEAGRKTNTHPGCIRKYLKGKYKLAGGSKWRLVKPTDKLRDAIKTALGGSK